MVEKIKKFISGILELTDTGELDVSKIFIELGMNSVAFIKLIVSLESEFNIEFDDDDLSMERFPTINDMIDYVQNKITSC